MEVKDYLEQFHVIGIDEINCDYLSQLLYTAFLNKFKINLTEEEYEYFREYQERVFDLVENLRELEINFIQNVFQYLNSINPSLVDIIIMSWSFPRPTTFLSKKMYHRQYKQNIKNYHQKLIELIDSYQVKNFCIETLTKKNSVPIHCTDLLWYYLTDSSIEITFVNTDYYLSVDSNYFSFNLEYMFELGIGQMNTLKGRFVDVLRLFITDVDLIKETIQKSGKNYVRQLLKIHQNPIQYFPDGLLIESKSDLLDNLISELKSNIS